MSVVHGSYCCAVAIAAIAATPQPQHHVLLLGWHMRVCAMGCTCVLQFCGGEFVP